MRRRRVMTDPPPPPRYLTWLGWAWRLGIAVAVFAALVWIDRSAPPQNLPWKPLDPDQPIGVATRAQLLRVALAPSSTCAELAEQALVLTSSVADPKDAAGPCGWEVARTVSRAGPARLAGESNMQCPLALGVGMWVSRADELAREHLGQGVARVHHYGSYSCRRKYSNPSSSWSEHAFANAWDVASFELDDGSLVSVLRDWEGSGAKSDFLRDVRDSACKVFRVTLSPDYNAAHADHFHIDMGPGSACR